MGHGVHCPVFRSSNDLRFGSSKDKILKIVNMYVVLTRLLPSLYWFPIKYGSVHQQGVFGVFTEGGFGWWWSRSWPPPSSRSRWPLVNHSMPIARHWVVVISGATTITHLDLILDSEILESVDQYRNHPKLSSSSSVYAVYIFIYLFRPYLSIPIGYILDSL